MAITVDEIKEMIVEKIQHYQTHPVDALFFMAGRTNPERYYRELLKQIEEKEHAD